MMLVFCDKIVKLLHSFLSQFVFGDPNILDIRCNAYRAHFSPGYQGDKHFLLQQDLSPLITKVGPNVGVYPDNPSSYLFHQPSGANVHPL